jgi:SAM-dependent methyltransferase
LSLREKALRTLRDDGPLALGRRTARWALTQLVELVKSPLHADAAGDPYHAIFKDFVAQVNARPGLDLLELGARARSGNTHRQHFAGYRSYTGFDILPGAGVDAVGDIHELSRHFPRESFDAAFSVSVFEHLAMPWKVALELNRVLRPGALAFVATHPTYPPHDQPWDFFRFSPSALAALFNARTGFRIERCAEGLPCAIVPLVGGAPLVGLWRARAHLGIAMIARKIGEPDPALRWDVATSDVLAQGYPEDVP